MKIIFVGIHNKPGKTPLCSSTKSGKLIDRIISEFKPVKSIKTNLINKTYLPEENWKIKLLVNDWRHRIDIKEKDIIVLLGRKVLYWFDGCNSDKIITVDHPASKWSTESMNQYVFSTVQKIKHLL